MHLDDLYRKTQAASGNPWAEAWREAADRDAAELEGWLINVPLVDCSLFEVYEALATAPTPPLPLLAREFERLMEAAESAPKNGQIPAQLEAFAFLHDSIPFRDRAVEILSRKLRSPKPQTRRLASQLLADFATAADHAALAQVRTLIRRDSDWRVRYIAFRALQDIRLHDPLVAAPPSLGVSDKLKRLVLGDRSARNITA